jgi:hypothetical protein
MKRNLLFLAFSVIFLSLQSVPAISQTVNVTGTWKAEFDSQIGNQKYTFDLKQEGAVITGKISSVVEGEKHETVVKDGKLDGTKISFIEVFKFQDNEINITYTGTVGQDLIDFTRQVGDFATEKITAKRVKTESKLF